MDKSFLIFNHLKTNDLTQWLRASLMKWAKIHETFPYKFIFRTYTAKFPAPQPKLEIGLANKKRS